MIDALFTVTQNGLIPETEIDAVQSLKLGETVRAKITRTNPRNARFFRKWWTLVKYAFEHWEPPPIKGWKFDQAPQKNIQRFRKDLIILAGYYDADYRLDGSVRIEAKSIAWANMHEDEFEKLYSATINAVLEHVLTQYTRDDLDDVVARLLAGYA